MRRKALLNCFRGWFVGGRGDVYIGRRVEVAKGRRRVYGQSLVEFALICPVFVMMVMGVVDLGRVFYTYEALANASREGARYCALHAHDLYASNQSSATSSRVLDEVNGTVANVSVFGSAVGQPACDTAISSGSLVTVSAQATFTPITPIIANLFPGGTITITASASMMMQ